MATGSAPVTQQIVGSDRYAKAQESLLRKGRDLLSDKFDRILKRSVRRFIKGDRVMSLMNTDSLFNEQDLGELSNAIAKLRAPADLLGQFKSWDRRDRAISANKRQAARSGIVQEVEVEKFIEPTFELDELAPLRPEAALRQFAGMIPRLYATPQEWAQGIRTVSFTMAVASDTAMLVRVRGLIGKQLLEGIDPKLIRQEIEDVILKEGLEPLHSQYADMVLRTNTLEATRAAEDITDEDPDIQEVFPVWQYIGINDGRTGDDHLPLIEQAGYYPIYVPFREIRNAAGDSPRPWNCRCGKRKVTIWEWAELYEAGERTVVGDVQPVVKAA